ncbi:MAG TPA: M48 family metallopeptidase [Planctomycetota bacterium]|nr:M48 family metallopeptidase [Planctomycetota bacterium]
MPYYGGHGRLSMRWIIALVMAAVGLISYYWNTEVNPVTGEKQRVALTTDQEIAIGLQSAPEMAAQMGGEVSPKHPQAQLIRSIGERIWKSSDAQRSPYTFDFHLLADPKTVNAFALPGGQIFITVGLLNRLENEAQVAGVLGHEIGHVIHRHSAEHMAKGRLGQLLAGAAGVAASDEYGRGRGAMIAAQVVNQMLQLRYSRSDESEADEHGLLYMTQAGYDPSAMLGVMKVLAEASRGNRQPEFLASHPHPDARYEKIKEFLAQNYPNGIPAELTQGRPLNPAIETDYR